MCEYKRSEVLFVPYEDNVNDDEIYDMMSYFRPHQILILLK